MLNFHTKITEKCSYDKFKFLFRKENTLQTRSIDSFYYLPGFTF